MTAAAILDTCSPSLEDAFVEELLTDWHVGPEEAVQIRAIVSAWGEEPNNRMTREERRAEIRGRVESYLRAARGMNPASAVLQ